MRTETKERLTTVSKTVMFGCIDRAFDDLEMMEDWGHILEELGAEMPEGLMDDIDCIRKLSAKIHRTMYDYAEDTFDVSEMLADRGAGE